MESPEPEWIDLRPPPALWNNKDYEISTSLPHLIRRKSDQKLVHYQKSRFDDYNFILAGKPCVHRILVDMNFGPETNDAREHRILLLTNRLNFEMDRFVIADVQPSVSPPADTTFRRVTEGHTTPKGSRGPEGRTVAADVGEWVQLDRYPQYEIQTEFPFLIRQQTNKQIQIFIHNGSGYLQCLIGDDWLYHHRIVAEQFIPNPDNLPEVDHCQNHIRDDNHLENLRWVSHSENQRNKKSYNGRVAEYLDTLPEGSEPVTEANGRPVRPGYYVFERAYYVAVGRRFRRLSQTKNKRSVCRVQLRGVDGKAITISWTE